MRSSQMFRKTSNSSHSNINLTEPLRSQKSSIIYFTDVLCKQRFIDICTIVHSTCTEVLVSFVHIMKKLKQKTAELA